MNKYFYLHEPYDVENSSLSDKIYRTLADTSGDAGELEEIKIKLENTQFLLANLMLFLITEKGLLKEEDWKKIRGE